MKITLIYDWNGTLLDDASLACACVDKVFAKAGKGVCSFTDFQQHFQVPLNKFYENFGFDVAQTPTILKHNQEIWHKIYEDNVDTVPLRAGAGAFLRDAARINLHQAILSNHIIEAIRHQLHRLKIDAYFNEVLAHESVEHQSKWEPKREKLRGYMAAEGIDPSQTFIFGDTPEEIEIARELSLTSVAITGGYVCEERLRAAKPDYVIHDWDDMRPILRDRGVAL